MIKKEMAEEERVEVSELEIELVKDIFKTITKTIKTFNVYPKDNPIYRKFVSELFEKFSVFFDSSDELTIDIRQYSLLYKDHEVFSSEERSENIAMLLFADGIRQLDFHKGIGDEELTDFIEIIRTALKSKADDEDDIVTLLWEKNIRNMGYTAVEDTIDDELAVEDGLFQKDRVESVGEETTVGDGSFQWRPESAAAVIEIPPPSEEDLSAAAEEIAAISETATLSAAIDLFFELLKSEPGIEFFPEIVMSTWRILAVRLQKRDIEECIRILSGLSDIAAVCDPNRLEVVKGVLSKAGEPENLSRVAESSEGEQVRRYFSLVAGNSIRSIVQILADVQDRKQRKIICEVLAETGRDAVEILGELAEDTRWYLVRNIVFVLGLIRDPSAVKYLEKTAKNPDVRVRRETVRALENIRVEETKRIFLGMLKDPDLTIRVSALKSLRRFKDSAIFGTLKGSASRDELKKRPFVEKRELLETLAVLGGDEAIPILSGLLKKRWLIEKDDSTEIRAAAAYGLGLVGGPEAKALLEREADSRKRLLKQACANALRVLQANGNIRR